MLRNTVKISYYNKSYLDITRVWQMDGRRDDREVIPKCRPASQATQKKRYGVNVDETTQNHRINTAIKHKNMLPYSLQQWVKHTLHGKLLMVLQTKQNWKNSYSTTILNILNNIVPDKIKNKHHMAYSLRTGLTKLYWEASILHHLLQNDTRNVIVVQTMDGITTVRLSFLK